MRLLAAILLGLLLGCTPAPPQPQTLPGTELAQQQAGPRIALIIGVSGYSGEIPALPNPTRDADLVAAALQGTGFQVTVLKDPNRRQLVDALTSFASNAAQAGAHTTGLIYFAGHGLQVNGVNYLLPADAHVPAGLSPDLPTALLETTLDDAFVKAQDFIAALPQSDGSAGILVLDACRDNPVSRSISGLSRGALGAGRGLAEMQAPSGILISYATGPGEVSYDGDGENSPFAIAFAAEIRRPGQATDVFSRIRVRVREATGGRQIPLELYRLERPFCFSTCAAADVAAPEAGGTNIGVSRHVASEDVDSVHQELAGLSEDDLKAERIGPDTLLAGIVQSISKGQAPNSVQSATFFMALGGGGALSNCDRDAECESTFENAGAVVEEVARQGDARAQWLMGRLLVEGQSIAKNEPRGVAWLQQSADQQFAPAQAYLAAIYSDGLPTAPRNDARAAQLAERAVEQDDVLGQVVLGMLYSRGRGGLRTDQVEAVRLFRLAADRGQPGAKAQLGWYYMNGRGGLPQNDQEAVRLFQAAGTIPMAERWLGFMYEKGRGGLVADRTHAVQLYRDAARRGDQEAQGEMRRLGEVW
ncbi:MAG TPA: caspase family protein [Caulobacterales bacterium]|nr:caspase family protein [Caulobacterales bacterium]